MAVYGYHRTSTIEQHLDRGIKAIKEYCASNGIPVKKIVTDQKTGKNFDRPGYQGLREYIEKNDVLILAELDRLGRNKQDTLKELQHYKDIGVRVMILEIPTTLVDYSSMGNDMAAMIMETINNMLIEMYATFAHAEMQKREKRQQEGIATMKERGEWDKYGRPAAIDMEAFKREYQKVIDGTMKPFECMRKLGLTKPTFYRYRGYILKDAKS